ncbi:MAG: MFS transporter [Rhodospirillaceae bacterium]|nr:MFS transporter [Rhodospirillaceae bacterium]
MTDGTQSRQTQWPIVWVAFGAGIVAATHIGKLPPALPEIRLALDAGLVTGGWIASMISCTGFALGLVAGSLADRLGQRQVLIFGLLAMTAGSLLGAFAQSGEVMLLSRFIEGVGYTSVTITGAGMITHVTAAGDRKWALGIWSSYVPVGFSVMLIAGALVLEAWGWRTLWLISSGITVVWAGIVWKATLGWQRQSGNVAMTSMLNNVTRCLASPGALLAAGCFALYASQHISMMAWLPSYMREVYGSSTLVAAVVPAVVLMFNAIGNWFSAWAMGRGVSIWSLLAVGAIGMGLSQIGIFSAFLPDTARLGFAVLFGIFGGMVPAAALGSVAIYTPSPSQIGTMNGLMVMGTSTGMLFGPPAVAAMRAVLGNWNDVVWLMVSLATVGVILAVLSRRLERRANAARSTL